jgi:cilia- and flagella-associated protein 44
MEETKENSVPDEVDVQSLRKPISVADLGKEMLGLHHTFGNDFTRRNNISLIEEGKIIYAAGNNIIIENLVTNAKDYLLSIDEGGVGAVAVHPSKQLFAVGCKGVQPNIYIYSYPDIKLLKILRNGAERGYSCLSFNKAGNELASVASAPDFMLTIWLWDEEKIFLHAKAFGQEVYNVRFSQDDDRRLTTSGTGHIRFWKMASTFTGQKLQGSIGKFGKVDLTDISAFVEFPDGKVCSGTENGSLLIWEGNFIKCRFVRKDGLLCHDGEVTSVELDRDQNCLVTAGHDGYIRWWCVKEIDSAEVDADHSIDYEIEPLKEFKNPSGKAINTLVDNGAAVGSQKSLYILDSAGQFSSVEFQYGVEPGIPADTPAKILSTFHGSSITGMSSSPNSYLVATSGSDGRVIVSNFKDRVNICSTMCEVGATSIVWVPLHIDPSGQSIAVGCANGTLKVFKIVPNDEVSEESPDLFVLVQVSVLKPHTKAINAVSFSRSSTVMATASLDGMVFFFDCKPTKEWVPLRFVTMSVLEEGKVPTHCTSMSWSGACLLLGCSDGVAREVDANVIIVEANQEAHSFEAEVQPKCMSVKVPVVIPASAIAVEETTDENDAEEKPEGPVTTLVAAKITKCVYSFAESNKNHDQYFLSTSSTAGQQLFKGVFASEAVDKELTMGMYSADGKEMTKTPAVTCMKYSSDREFLFMGTADGSVMIRPTNFIDVFSSVICHNSSCGGVSAVSVSFDTKFILSCGNDGLLVVHRFKPIDFLTQASPLFLDLDAGVFAGQVDKPSKPNEPRHLQRVCSMDALSDFFNLDIEEERTIEATIKKIDDLQTAENIDGNAYSIQDSKLKSESDNQKSAAEVKKDKIRQIVGKLRREFDDLRFHNDQLPDVIKLSIEDLCIDGEYFSQLEAKGKKMIEEVKFECEYEAEKALTLRRKMFSRLMTDVMVEEMPLYGFRELKPPKVLSLRTIGMDKSLQDSLAAVHESIREEEHDLSKTRVLEELESDELLQVEKEATGMMDKSKHVDKMVTSKNIDKLGSSSHTSGLHARREARLLRIDKLKKHDIEKPKEHEDDPRDIEAILHAEKTIGSYALKCADDYKVPEDQIINAHKKRRQMLMLQESMITLRLRFNERFLNMRKLKQKIVESMQTDNSRIREIDEQLQCANSEIIYEPNLRPSEFPDDRNLMTKQEILDFKMKRREVEWKKIPAPPNSILTGDATTLEFNPINGLFNVNAKDQEDSEEVGIEFDPSVVDSVDDIDSASCGDSVASVVKKSSPQIIDFFGCSDAGCDLESLEFAMPVLLAAKECRKSYITEKAGTEISDERKFAISEHKRSLIFEKQSLMKKSKQHMEAFDENIQSLRLERHHLAGDLKLAELQLLTLYQEYTLLLGFEDKDNALRQKEDRCTKEKLEIQESITDFQSKFEAKSEDQVQWSTKSASLLSDFRVLVPDNNPFFDILTKIFKKKIKRSKGTDDMDGDEEDSEEDDDDDDDDYDDDEVEDVCPSGCDATLYDKVLDYREKRLDIEEVMTEIQKVIDDFKKSLDRLRGREKQINKESKAAMAEMQTLQLSKQSALNKIEVCVPLKVSQLHTFRNSGVMSGPNEEPAESKEEDEGSQILHDASRRQMVESMDITSHTLFNGSFLDKLSLRIGELKDEIVAAKVDLKSFHKEKVRLEKERGAQRANIENWTDKCNELQMLKFGRLIDLDVLEKGSDHTKLEEAEDAVSKVESELQTTMRKLQEEYDTLNERLAKTTAANTQNLKQMGDLVSRKLTMTRELNLPKDSFAADPQLTDFKDSIERSKLSAFVKLQYREIDSLKSEITMLRRKETAQFAAFLPPAPAMSMTSNAGLGGVTLPPINNKRMESKSTNGGLRPQGSADEIFGSQTSGL